MKKKIILTGGIIVVLLIIILAFTGGESSDGADLIVDVERGEFLVDITTTGELEAKNFVNITGPSTLRNYRIYNITIQKIAEEGKVLKKGDYVATLDPSELNTRIKDTQIELEKIQSQYTQTQLDTTLNMRQARDELINLEYGVEEKAIVLEQSKFEPPATIKQAEIELSKAKRAFQQAKENYKIKYRQSVAKMQEVSASLRKQKNELEGMMELQKGFVIRAPEDGMLIYRKGWDGKPIKEGSQISAWDPTVATLPDLSTMMSKTFVNEVDVRKIKVGQSVDIGLDAFPEKKLKGKVINVANVGEQRPNSDAKVFQVNIEVAGKDDLLRPAMTTSNVINTKRLSDVIYIPLEALHNAYDSITFVYKASGLDVIKQEIIVGATNSNEAVIEKGLEETDRVYLSVPSDTDGDITLLPELNGKRNSEAQTAVEQSTNERNSDQSAGRREGGRRGTGN